MQKSANYARRVAQGLAAGMSLAAAQAWAAVPANVTTSISDGSADAATIGWALVAFAIAFGVILMIKRKAG